MNSKRLIEVAFLLKQASLDSMHGANPQRGHAAAQAEY